MPQPGGAGRGQLGRQLRPGRCQEQPHRRACPWPAAPQPSLTCRDARLEYEPTVGSRLPAFAES